MQEYLVDYVLDCQLSLRVEVDVVFQLEDGVVALINVLLLCLAGLLVNWDLLWLCDGLALYLEC